MELQLDIEGDMRQQLKIQAQAHSDHLADVLDVKEKELERHFNRILNEKLEQEQSAYKIQISAMLGRLRGMEDGLKCNMNDIMRIFYVTNNQDTMKSFLILPLYYIHLSFAN